MLHKAVSYLAIGIVPCVPCTLVFPFPEPAYLQPLAPSVTETTSMTLLYIKNTFCAPVNFRYHTLQSVSRCFLDKCHAAMGVGSRQMLRNEARLVMLVPHPSGVSPLPRTLA